MSERSQGRRAVIIGAAALVALVALPFVPAWTPTSDTDAAATSGMWLCPHGGGVGWTVTLTIANPGASTVSAIVRTFEPAGLASEETIDVPAGQTVRIDVDAPQRAAASVVEYFGGWVAAGWTAAPETGGVAAEPCASRPSTSWYLPDLSTVETEDDYLVVMNPYSADAVYSVSLFAVRSAPTRTDQLTDRLLPAGTVDVVRISDTLLGEETVSAVVDAQIGRIAVSTLAVTTGGGLRAALGYASTPSQVILPSGADRGRSDLVVVFPDRAARLSAAILASGDERAIPDIATADVPDESAYNYPYSTLGASAVVLSSSGRGLAAARSYGVGPDLGSTIGATGARAWVVLPTVAISSTLGPGDPLPQIHPGLVLANAGTSVVTVTLRILGGDGTEITVIVPARSAVEPPRDFLDALGGDAVLVLAEGGNVVAAGASMSRGERGKDAYAVALGVKVPPGRLGI